MRRLIAEGLNTVPWVTVHGMKVNHTDLELFQLMKAAGCKRVGFGVENGDPWMLRNVIRKGQTLDQVRRLQERQGRQPADHGLLHLWHAQ